MLTLLAIGIGIGAVVAMGGITAGFIDQLTDMVGGSNAHLVAIEAGIPLKSPEFQRTMHHFQENIQRHASCRQKRKKRRAGTD